MDDLRSRLSYSNLEPERERRPRAAVEAFSGTLADIGEQENQYGDMEVVLGFKDITVTKAETPYVGHTVQLFIKESTRTRSAYGLFFESVLEAAGISRQEAKEKGVSIFDFVSRELELELTTFNYGTDRVSGKEMVGNVWHCVTISTPTPKLSPKAIAVSLLEGKADASAWAAAVVTHPQLKGNSNVSKEVIAISDEGILVTLRGIVTQDAEGVFHVDTAKLATL